MKTDEEYREGYLSNIDTTAVPRSLSLYSQNRNKVEQEMDWRDLGFVSQARV